MSEFNDSDQPPIPSWSPIRQYFSDVGNIYKSYASVKLALGSMVENSPVQLISTHDILKCDYMPTEDMLDIEPRISKEKLVLLPLMSIGPVLDCSDTPVDVVYNWYDDCVDGILAATKGDHDEWCLETYNTTNLLCPSSSVCPQRFLEDYLTIDILSTDFSKVECIFDPLRFYELTMKKLAVAVKHEIILPKFAESVKQAYTEDFEQYFHISTK